MSQTYPHQPLNVHRERGLGWMVMVSAGLHVVAVALAVVLPYSLRDDSPKQVSYSVDLVAPDRLGGTNIPGPPKKAPLAKAAPAPPPAPAAAREPAAAPKPEPAKKEPAPKVAKKEVPPPPKPVAKPKKAAEKAPVKVSAKKAEKPKPAPAEKKAEPAKKKAEPAKKEIAAEKPKAAPASKAETEAEPSLEEQREAIAARLRDERLAAAVQRAQSRVEQEPDISGEGAGDPSLPASYGPGEGAGGILKGLDWIMYKNRVETMIRENWAWTGSDRSLEATVRFGITETGEVVNFTVDRSSGDLTYDASIERAIKGVSPLPPPPEAYRQEFSEYELTFNAEFLQM